MLKTVEDFQTFTRGQFEAASKSAAALSTGLQAIATETADYSKKSLEAGSTVFQDLIGTRSVESALKIQMDYARSAFESFSAETGKVGRLWSATAQNCFKPLEEAFGLLRSTIGLPAAVAPAAANG